MLRNMGLESLRLDLDDSESIRAAVAEILDRTGGTLDALFNNGAFGLPGAVEDLSRDAIRAQFETNLFGWLELTNLVLPVMRKQGFGRIIQNSSILGLVAMPYRGAYNSSKFAIEGMSDTLRLELRGSNIHISLIEPGPILSKFRANSVIALEKYVDIEHSVHADFYKRVLARPEKTGTGGAVHATDRSGSGQGNPCARIAPTPSALLRDGANPRIRVFETSAAGSCTGQAAMPGRQIKPRTMAGLNCIMFSQDLIAHVTHLGSYSCRKGNCSI